MYQRFQEYFKGNNIKIFLKYDGERKNKNFTVMIINKDDSEKTLFKDTDNPYEVFLGFIKELKINISEEVNKVYFDTFMILKKKLDKIIKSNLVFIFTSEIINDPEFYISILSDEVTTNFKSTCIKDLVEYIDNLR